MALESGMRRVRMVGAEHWTDTPERELPTFAAGGDVYAVHERVCIDSARVRLVLAEGEDVAAAQREVYGEAVRDVRVFRLVGSSAEVVEGLPEWRLTLPLVDDAEHDPLPGMIARLAGAVPAPAFEEPVVDEPMADEAVVEEPVVPVLEPVAIAEDVVDVVVEEPVADEAVGAEPALEEPGLPALAAAAAAAAAVAAPEAEAEDPFAVPAETVFPLEAASEPVQEPVAEVAAEEAVLDEAAAEEAVVEEVVAAEPAAEEDATEVEAVEEPAAEAAVEEPAAEPEPDPRDLAHAPTAAVLEVGRPTCPTVDREGPCSTPSDVIWQTEAGAAWACAWHWPSTMAGYPGAEVGAVHAGEAWSTWRDGDSVALARQAADLFAEAARAHGQVARPLVALDRLDEMLRSLPDDLRGAILLWSISVTNPEWEVAAVAEHGRATHELVVAEGRAVAFPDEIYFQQAVAHAPIVPAVGEAEPEAPVAASAEALFARGTALASSGDLRGASQAWTEAAESYNHALSMRALGDLSSDRDDLKTAEEWYGRAAMANDTASMVRIATLLEGRGQQERAAEWLRRAARFGDEEAVRRLAHPGVVGASA